MGIRGASGWDQKVSQDPHQGSEIDYDEVPSAYSGHRCWKALLRLLPGSLVSALTEILTLVPERIGRRKLYLKQHLDYYL